MITKLVKRGNDYYCNNCFMKQSKIIDPYCYFCGETFSNYEEEIIKIFNEE
jgi:hypothetical protein